MTLITKLRAIQKSDSEAVQNIIPSSQNSKTLMCEYSKKPIANKVDTLKLRITANSLVQDCSFLQIDLAPIELAGNAAHRKDRGSNSGQSKGRR